MKNSTNILLRYRLLLFVPVYSFLLFLTFLSVPASAQTSSSPWPAKYATGGTGAHTREICWLTWGTANSTITNGTYYWSVTSSISIVATVSNLSSQGGNTNPLVAYNTGSYAQDGLNLLYSGINPIGMEARVSGDVVNFDISMQLLVNGVSVPYPGLVLGDAESMAVGEYISAVTNGTGWQLLDLRNAATANQTDYQLVIANAQKKMTIQSVNHSNLGMQAVLFAQGVTSLTNVSLKGSGLTSLAMGFIVPFDYGDAPASYGTAGHYINGFTPTGSTVTNGTYSLVNLTPSNLVPTANVYLGTANIDADANPPAGPQANYDDTSGTDDENGVSFTGGSLKVNQAGNYSVTVNATNANTGKAANIYGWIDFNGDGVFSANELATGSIPVNTTTATNITLTYNLSSYSYAAGTFKAGTSYARFRITTDNLVNSHLSPAADDRSMTAASDGEAEDYKVDIAPVSISGTVYSDPNGLVDNLVNGTGMAALGGNPFYSYLSQGLLIVGKTAVAPDGSYSFALANPGTNYVVTITTDASKGVGSSLTGLLTVLSGLWLTSGANYGTNNQAGSGNITALLVPQVSASVGSAGNDIAGLNFGLSQVSLLPLSLLSFDVSGKNDQVEVAWATSHEVSTDYFVLQYSNNGTDWSDQQKVHSSGMGGDSYTIRLLLPEASHNYYRLQMVDRNGSLMYSQVREADGRAAAAISVYPNPVRDRIYLSAGPDESITSVILLDMNGRFLLQVAGSSIPSLDLSALGTGHYIIKVRTGSGRVGFAKIVKER